MPLKVPAQRVATLETHEVIMMEQIPGGRQVQLVEQKNLTLKKAVNTRRG